MDRSEVKLWNGKKNCDISYTERDFETEKLHRKWAWGSTKTFKSFFFLRLFLCQNCETLGQFFVHWSEIWQFCTFSISLENSNIISNALQTVSTGTIKTKEKHYLKTKRNISMKVETKTYSKNNGNKERAVMWIQITCYWNYQKLLKIQTAKLMKCKNQEIQKRILYLSVHGTEWVDQKNSRRSKLPLKIAIVY